MRHADKLSLEPSYRLKILLAVGIDFYASYKIIFPHRFHPEISIGILLVRFPLTQVRTTISIEYLQQIYVVQIQCRQRV